MPRFKNREVIFDRVCVPELSADIFLGAMVDRAVTAKLAPDGRIDRRIVGHDVGRAVDVGDDDRAQSFCADIGDGERTNAAVALY